MAIESAGQKSKTSNHADEPPYDHAERPNAAVPAAPPSRVPPRSPTATNTNDDSYSEKNYRLNKRQFRVAILTLIVLAMYTSIAAYQACKMRDATDAATNQAALMRQQMVGTQAALIPTEDAIGLGLSAPTDTIDFTLRNVGHVNARKLVINFSVRRVSLPELATTGGPWLGEIDEPILAPTNEAIGARPTVRWFNFPLSSTQLGLINNFEQTIEISGDMEYDDGFGDHINEPFCFRLLTYRVGSQIGDASPRDCQQWPAAYAGALRRIQSSKKSRPNH